MATHFGDFTLDELRRQLLRGKKAIHLSPKALQLLSILIQESPNALSKQALQERLWPNTFVAESNVANIVAELRSALDDERREARYIRTIHGYGYAFAAAISDSETHSTVRLRRRRLTISALAAALTVMLLLVLFHGAKQSQITASQSIRSLAVLPFDTTGADVADQHLSVGLPDVLITRLSNVRQLIVRPTSAIHDYAGHRLDSFDAGRKLQVDAVLEGSVRTTPDRVRVTVRLLNVRTQKAIWGAEFDQKRSDVFAIEDAISEQVADALTMQLSPNEHALLAKRYTADPEAYNLYIEARYRIDQALREGRISGGFRQPIDLLEQAVRKDPSYALAWANLAQLYASAGGFAGLPPSSAFPIARRDVEKALQLDDELSEAHCASGIIKMYSDLDYAGAEREFQRALQLNPRNPRALMHYRRLVQSLGRYDEAIALCKRAVEIDPLNPGVQDLLAAAYVTARKDDLGIQQCQLILRMDPNFFLEHVLLARIYTLRGEYDKAIAEAREAVRTQNGRGHGLQSLAMLGYALGMSGRTSEATEILQRLEKDQRALPEDLAFVHLALGHRDEVLRLLEKGLDDRTGDSLRLKTEPIFGPLHSDPRFQALLQRAGFTAN